MDRLFKEIKKSFLFKDVSDDDIRYFVDKYPCSIVSFSKNDCVITREDTSKRIGVVLDGALGIYSDSFYGGHTLIGIAGPHYLFGFIAIFYNRQHSITTLYSHGKSHIAFFDVPQGQTAIEFITTTPPQILSNIYEMMTIHIKDDFDRQQIINSNSVEVKLTRYLLYLYLNTKKTTFSLNMNHTELSNFLGVYRTSLSREISRMENEKIISCSKGKIRILNLQALIDIESSSYD